MKFGIDIGHNTPPDTGAKGIVKSEDALTMEVGTLVMSKLEASGHSVVNLRPIAASSVRRSLQQRVNTANLEKVELVVSIHFNASENHKGHGAEVFAVSAIGKTYASSVLTEICKLGFFNRKVKDGSHLRIIEDTAMPAILVECCFCDNQQDVKLYDAESMANAIVRGLVNECGASLLQPSLKIDP